MLYGIVFPFYKINLNEIGVKLMPIGNLLDLTTNSKLHTTCSHIVLIFVKYVAWSKIQSKMYKHGTDVLGIFLLNLGRSIRHGWLLAFFLACSPPSALEENICKVNSLLYVNIVRRCIKLKPSLSLAMARNKKYFRNNMSRW